MEVLPLRVPFRVLSLVERPGAGKVPPETPMIYFLCWMIALSRYEQGAAEATDVLVPAGWTGNFWGPASWRARQAGQLPPLPSSPAIAASRRWGHDMLRDGDIVFRLGDARAFRGILPLSRFIAGATGSPFSHTGIVSVEGGTEFVYDCSSAGIQRQPFEIWMLDCVGALGVKRLRPEFRRQIPGVIGFCRAAYERQVPFDSGFRMDDDAFYCLELTEKAFRSQGLTLSEPVRIGDWENLASYPLTALAIPGGTGLALDRPITLEQSVFLPGNERCGVWASPVLETVYAPDSRAFDEAARGTPGQLSLRGDLDVLVFAVGALRRSYGELPARLVYDLVSLPRVRGILLAGRLEPRRPALDN
jgi:hypothetical protein